MPTGQPRVHSSPDHIVSKNPVGLSAWEPKKVAYWPSTAFWRSPGDIVAYERQSSPPTNPKITPGPLLSVASGGESSNVAVTGPLVSTAVPVRPSARQNGVSYTAATLVRAPWPKRCV